jgi:hypothetical protein
MRCIVIEYCVTSGTEKLLKLVWHISFNGHTKNDSAMPACCFYPLISLIIRLCMEIEICLCAERFGVVDVKIQKF